jgi:hypothetical protein
MDYQFISIPPLIAPQFCVCSSYLCTMPDEIINKVASSGLITLNLEDYYTPGERVVFDMKDVLYEGIVLKEKEFRAFVKEHDWAQYQGKFVALTCSTDAIIPTWAYMLVTLSLQPYAASIVAGSPDELETSLFMKSIASLKPADYTGERVVIKGCSKVHVPLALYVEITKLIRPFAKSIMYGEPCSTVPLFRQK